MAGTPNAVESYPILNYIFGQVYDSVGFTTTDGIYISDQLMEKGDTTGPKSAQVILQDPTVDIAVLETARGGILRSGLGFQTCDVSVVLSVAADHLGIGDIETIDRAD